eukprot:s2348_g2.t1
MHSRKRILRAGLRARADFERIQVRGDSFPPGIPEDVPLQAALFLFKNEEWQECADVLTLMQGEWGPTSTDNDLGKYFVCVDRAGTKLSIDRIQSAAYAGIDIRKLGYKEKSDPRVYSLLGLAIVCGQQDCAVACVSFGQHRTGLEQHRHINSSLRDYLHNEAPSHPHHSFPSGAECRLAAATAGQAALRASWKREAAQKGVAVCQVMRKMLGSKSFPLALVGDILTFSTEVPTFVDELDLWDLMDGTGSASDAAAVPAPAEAMEVDSKSTDELMTALRASRDQVPALNMDGVCVFRLTRMATSSHVNDLLLDATGPLATLHARVLDAGCEVNPENPVKALFVPVTEEQMEELRALADQGYELNKDDHILALQADQDVISAALKKHLRFKNRPKIKKVGPESMVAPEEDLEEVDEAKPLIVEVWGYYLHVEAGSGLKGVQPVVQAHDPGLWLTPFCPTNFM